MMTYKLRVSLVAIVLFLCSFSLAYYINNTPQSMTGSGDISQETTIEYNDYLQSTKERE